VEYRALPPRSPPDAFFFDLTSVPPPRFPGISFFLIASSAPSFYVPLIGTLRAPCWSSEFFVAFSPFVFLLSRGKSTSIDSLVALLCYCGRERGTEALAEYQIVALTPRDERLSCFHVSFVARKKFRRQPYLRFCFERLTGLLGRMLAPVQLQVTPPIFFFTSIPAQRCLEATEGF